ncbi:hypothetical protein KNP414_03022 [Paenibacillus mucilaginosus KNP414]|uniref:Uncharacterized protein n=1 Tax=Paenibacillus mucilaginosus (strain KNP414) TaxID=1036673 RepID=F8F8J2_PAEMK|nr:hypothetical protein KNP414_03022 [Paenibacillus mucilaginosus KNP414]
MSGNKMNDPRRMSVRREIPSALILFGYVRMCISPGFDPHPPKFEDRSIAWYYFYIKLDIEEEVGK